MEDDRRVRSAPEVDKTAVADTGRADEDQEGTAHGEKNLTENALPSTPFPFFINERGNRVFAVPRTAARCPP